MIKLIFSVMIKVPVLVSIMIALAAPAAAQSGGAANPSKEGKKTSAASQTPMVFYLAKGEPGFCGPACSEWIAAEGRFDEGAAQRLRALLSRMGNRKLPILFHSSGGLATTASEIGRLLRDREMTAGVYQTIPAGCAGASEQGCRALKQAGQVLPAALRNDARCDSACVFALIGAKVRQVPPVARLGIHSIKLVVEWGHAPSYSERQMESYEKRRLAEINAKYRRYVQEMKVDVRLFDLILQVPHESIHYLSRDEIVQFGIDNREFQETRWDAPDLGTPELWGLKFFVERPAKDRKELHTSFLRISCQSLQRVSITYFRNAGSGEPGAGTAMKLAAGDRVATLSRFGSVVKMDAVEPGASYMSWATLSSFDFIEAVAARDTIEISEPGDAEAVVRVTKLSTAGLPQTISALRQRCGPKPG
jgi:hypothetical protein